MKSELGKLTLGDSALGDSNLIITQYEYIKLDDGLQFANLKIMVNEALRIMETLNGRTLLSIDEIVKIGDSAAFNSDIMAGVLGIITVVLDVTKTDMCEMVLEGGQTIEVNGTPARGFAFIKQRGQRFDHGVGINPGDAVLFTCPDDPVITVRDIVVFDNKMFVVADTINHYFANNIIYKKSALQRLRIEGYLPSVAGLRVSDNYEGSVSLSWLPIDRSLPVDYYEVWESAVGEYIEEPITLIQNATTLTRLKLGTPYSAGRYMIGGIVQIRDSHENEGYYVIQNYFPEPGQGVLDITASEPLSTTGALGTVCNISNYYMRGTTTKPSLSIRGMPANLELFYIVRGIDMHGNAGGWSTEEYTPTLPTPPDVEGLR